jgi:hypothetical protein
MRRAGRPPPGRAGARPAENEEGRAVHAQRARQQPTRLELGQHARHQSGFPRSRATRGASTRAAPRRGTAATGRACGRCGCAAGSTRRASPPGSWGCARGTRRGPPGGPGPLPAPPPPPGSPQRTVRGGKLHGCDPRLAQDELLVHRLNAVRHIPAARLRGAGKRYHERGAHVAADGALQGGAVRLPLLDDRVHVLGRPRQGPRPQGEDDEEAADDVGGGRRRLSARARRGAARARARARSAAGSTARSPCRSRRRRPTATAARVRPLRSGRARAAGQHHRPRRTARVPELRAVHVARLRPAPEVRDGVGGEALRRLEGREEEAAQPDGVRRAAAAERRQEQHRVVDADAAQRGGRGVHRGRVVAAVLREDRGQGRGPGRAGRACPWSPAPRGGARPGRRSVGAGGPRAAARAVVTDRRARHPQQVEVVLPAVDLDDGHHGLLSRLSVPVKENRSRARRLHTARIEFR